MNYDENNKKISDEQLNDVSGGAMNMLQELGVLAAIKFAKASGYTLDDMDLIFEIAHKADESGKLVGVTAQELEEYIRRVWDLI